MKKQLLLLLLCVLCTTVYAAVPDPVGVWLFDNPDPNLVLQIEEGYSAEDLVLVGTHDTVDGITPEDGAMQIGVGSHYRMTHNIDPNDSDGVKVNEWTILIDFRYPFESVGVYKDLLQTDSANLDDSDWTVAGDGAVGIAAVGYTRSYDYLTDPNTWYRMVMPVKNGESHDLYMDGVKIFSGIEQGVDGRFSLDDVLLLFAANDGDDNLIYVSSVAIWDVALDAGEIFPLGLAGDAVTSDTVSPIVDAGEDQLVDIGDLASIDVQLDATVTDADSSFDILWTKISGPDTISFNSTTIEDPLLTITGPGRYILQISADDGEHVPVDTVVITVIQNNLMARWEFEETWDGLKVLDSSGSGLDGTVVDGPAGLSSYKTGKSGQGLELHNGDFSIGGDYISLPLVMPDSGSIAFWYYPYQLYQYHAIFDNSVQADDWEAWIYVDGRMRFRVQGGTEVEANLVSLSQDGDPTDEWFHFVFTWNRTSDTTVDTQVYVGGVLIDETIGGPWVDPGSTFYLGGGNSGNDYCDGKYDRVNIFNKVLTLPDILELIYEGNLPPIADAGDHVTTSLSSEDEVVINLDANIDYTDGSPIGETTILWTKVSGPNDISFDDTGIEDPTVTITSVGIYVLELTVDDGQLADTDTVALSVYSNDYGNLLMEWTFEETWNGTAVLDTSPTGINNGTVVDGTAGTSTYITGKIGQGLELHNGNFATNGDHIEAPLVMPDSGSIAFWYKIYSLYDYHAVFDNSVEANDWETWIYAAGNMRFRVQSGTEVEANLPVLAQDGDARDEWFHMVFTWNRTSDTTVDTQAYIDGDLIAETIGGPWVDPGLYFYLGGGNIGNDYCDGVFDQVRVYDKVLSSTEVRSGIEGLVVNAGEDATEWLSPEGTVTLGLDGGIIGSDEMTTILWSKVSGPNDIVFVTPDQEDTDVVISAPGDYVLKLEASDEADSDWDLVVLEILANGDTGMIAHWTFDNGDITDSSGNGNDGTWVDGSVGTTEYVPGKLAKALDLQNGDYAANGDYVSLGLVMPDEGALSMWYKVLSMYNYQAIFDNSVQADDWEGWIYSSGVLRWRIQSGTEVSADLHALSSDGNAIGDWFHFVFAWERLSDTTAHTLIYVNGKLIQQSIGGPWVAPGSTFYLAGGNAGNDFGDGIWDDVRIYDRRISPKEIAILASMSDFDGDYDVDFDDFGTLIGQWMIEVAECTSTPQGDYTVDCKVDISDFAKFAEAYLLYAD